GGRPLRTAARIRARRRQGQIPARYRGRRLVDTIAWEPERPGRWLSHRDLVTHVGQDELDRSFWDETPARMVATPAAFVACHGQAFCILDWSADLNAIIGRAAAVECDSEELRGFLSRALHRQATAHLRTLKIAAARRRAA